MITWLVYAHLAFAGGLPIGLTEPLDGWWRDAQRLEQQGNPKAAMTKIRFIRRAQPNYLPALLAE